MQISSNSGRAFLEVAFQRAFHKEESKKESAIVSIITSYADFYIHEGGDVSLERVCNFDFPCAIISISSLMRLLEELEEIKNQHSSFEINLSADESQTFLFKFIPMERSTMIAWNLEFETIIDSLIEHKISIVIDHTCIDELRDTMITDLHSFGVLPSH